MNRSPVVSTYPEPRISQLLFASRASVPFWTVIRLYLGYLWFSHGIEKIQNPAWVGPEAGGAVTGFLNGALQLTGGEHPSVSGWYAMLIERVFLPNAFIMSHMVAFGELLIGFALIFGILTGVAAFFGGFMNAAFLFAGTVSANPIMFVLATWVVLAWRVAGYWGVDHWLLPRLGAPRGNMKQNKAFKPIKQTTVN